MPEPQVQEETAVERVALAVGQEEEAVVEEAVVEEVEVASRPFPRDTPHLPQEVFPHEDFVLGQIVVRNPRGAISPTVSDGS